MKRILVIVLLLTTGMWALPVAHQVALTWTQSASTDIDHDCVYRSQVSGVYTQANQLFCSAAGTPMTAYLDLTPKSGQTYFYVTTAVSKAGTESPFSNEVKTLIPQDVMPNTNLSEASQ